MRNDLQLLEIYINFIVLHMTKLDQIIDREKELNEKKNFFNKKRNAASILFNYTNFARIPREEWESIYSNPMEFENTRGRFPLLAKGGTVCAKTELQKNVEQFFYRLTVFINCCISANNEKNPDRELDKMLLETTAFQSNVNTCMCAIYPAAMEAIDQQKISINKEKKEIFIEVNRRHQAIPKQSNTIEKKKPSMQVQKPDNSSESRKDSSVQAEHSPKHTTTTTSQPSQPVPAEKSSKPKYWLATNGTVRCLNDQCHEECSMDCPIHVQTLALDYLMKNDFAQAARLLTKAVEIEPTFADAWNNLAACYGQMKQHQNAYEAYKKSYELLQKPNPLYGMAVAAKNMKKYQTALKYTETYVEKFGSDARIKTLIAEISENALSEKVSHDKQTTQVTPSTEKTESTPEPETEEVKHVTVAEAQQEKPVKAETSPSAAQSSNELSEVQLRYANAYLHLLDEKTRAGAYRVIEKLEKDLPEAGITLGQYYQTYDKEKAKEHFKIAADAGIAEGKWGYACLIPHSYIPDPNKSADAEWEKYCLEAAEQEHPDAAHEMGNICHRRGAIAEAAYWYGIAFFAGQTEADISLDGIVNEWIEKGKPTNYIAGTKNYTEKRHKAAIAFLKLNVGDIEPEEAKWSFDSNPDKLLGYYLGNEFAYAQKDYETSFDIYSKLIKQDSPYALLRYGNHMAQGRGTAKDSDGSNAYKLKAARLGCVPAMLAMGSDSADKKDYLAAAYWYALCYNRGNEKSGTKLLELKETQEKEQ